MCHSHMFRSSSQGQEFLECSVTFLSIHSFRFFFTGPTDQLDPSSNEPSREGRVKVSVDQTSSIVYEEV